MPDKIKLLVVDDEKQFLETISKRLSMRDFDVTPVSSGEEAIEAARKQEFETALVDLKMPGMGGEEVLEILKREHRFMEVVILTGYGSIDSAIKCTKAGVYGYLEKPCELETLLSVLREAYQRRVQNKLKFKDEKLKEIVSEVAPGSPLEILRKLKEMDRKLK
ncbi:MAG: response regulator [Syntrophales bacterium]|nr:response regulator [Syntrophales bacterium]